MEQRSEDLAYYLVEGPAPRNAVRVLAEEKVLLPGGEVTVAVIGSSHFLQIVAGNTLMTEVLASRRPALEGLEPTASGSAADEWQHEFQRDGVAYRFELQRSGCSVEELKRETARLAVSKANRLSCSFPDQVGDPGAITCIEWLVEGSRIAVDTYHTFPGEPAMVRSRSVIELPERGVAT